MYEFLDTFFIVFHLLLVVFALSGWMWRRTRKAHLGLLLLIAFSWLVLGIWYGIGYCPFTEWHWQVRYRLGYYDMPNSYMKFLLDSITGLNLGAKLVDHLTAIVFVLALAASIIVNTKDWKAGRA